MDEVALACGQFFEQIRKALLGEVKRQLK